MLIPISDLHDAPGPNPLKMEPTDYAMLVANLRKQLEHSHNLGSSAFGQHPIGPNGITSILQPLLVREYTDAYDGAEMVNSGGYEIVDGMHRRDAAHEAGWSQVECVVMRCSPDMARALRLQLNKLRGRVDLAIAAKDIELLTKAGWDETQLELTGFTADEITTLRGLVETPIESHFEPVAEPPQQQEKTQWVLEIPFASKEDYRRARRRLSKLAGKSGSLAVGLLKALAEE